MTLLLLGFLLAVLAVGWFAFERQDAAHRTSIDILQRDLAEAKHEAKVYRNLLFPVMAKVDASTPQPDLEFAKNQANAAPSRIGLATPAPTPPSKTSNSLNNRRIPWRLRSSLIAKSLNSKQQRTDALASELKKQPVQEKSNV